MAHELVLVKIEATVDPSADREGLLFQWVSTSVFGMNPTPAHAAILPAPILCRCLNGLPCTHGSFRRSQEQHRAIKQITKTWRPRLHMQHIEAHQLLHPHKAQLHLVKSAMRRSRSPRRKVDTVKLTSVPTRMTGSCGMAFRDLLNMKSVDSWCFE